MNLLDQIEAVKGINERTTDTTVYRLSKIVVQLYEGYKDLQEQIRELQNNNSDQVVMKVNLKSKEKEQLDGISSIDKTP